MKKILAILSALGLSAVSGSTVVACGQNLTATMEQDSDGTYNLSKLKLQIDKNTSSKDVVKALKKIEGLSDLVYKLDPKPTLSEAEIKEIIAENDVIVSGPGTLDDAYDLAEQEKGSELTSEEKDAIKTFFETVLTMVGGNAITITSTGRSEKITGQITLTVISQ